MKTRSYIIIGIHKKTGKILGHVENSFNMNFRSDCVRVYRNEGSSVTPNLYNRLNESAERYQKRFKHYNWKVYRVGSKHCPVKIDWRWMALRRQHKVEYDKFQFRNLPFKVVDKQ